MQSKPDGFLSRQKIYKRHRTEDFEDELNNLFNKKFRFRSNGNWKLPDGDSWFSAPPWKVKELESLKSRLNFHKSQLNDFNLEEWSSHTRRRNPAGEVCWKVRCMVNPEFLTQAWTKFYECACNYNVVPWEVIADKKIVSLHLCEAPGAFISSLNHYLKQHYQDTDWKWVANTLNPYYEGNSPSYMISDDRFMFHTLDNWVFGEDNTGNLMKWENSQAIVKRAKSLGKVLLVTADGSIDCLLKPDAQEELTSPLHYCEIVTALQSLNIGGTLLFKLFTMFEHSTVCLLYLLNNLFTEVNIYKPVTSRQGNSEVYAVCLRYKGSKCFQQYLPTLKTAYGTELYGTSSLFPLESIPENFLKQIEECAYYFSSIQCQVINNNLQAYLMQNNIALHIEMKKIRNIVANEFIRQYDVKPLPIQQEILKGVLHEENKINTNPRYQCGSYTERSLFSKLSLKEKCKTLNSFLQADILTNSMIFIKDSIRWLQFYDETFDLKLRFTYGYPLRKINSSKFIFVPIFKLYHQILAEEEFKEVILAKQATDTVKTFEDINTEINREVSLPDYNHSDCYDGYEKKCFTILLDVLSELTAGDTLLVRNFNALTHFNVSILFILSKKCFEKTGFTPCNSIILSKFVNKSALEELDVIKNECIKVRDIGIKDVLNSLPVQITNGGEFFNSIVFYNNTFYKNKCTQFLFMIEQSL